MDREKLHRLLRLGIEKGASDIHFQVGYLPALPLQRRIWSSFATRCSPRRTPRRSRAMLLEGDPRARALDFNELDLAYELPGEGRFRVNISRQRRFYNIVLRVIPLQIKRASRS